MARARVLGRAHTNAYTHYIHTYIHAHTHEQVDERERERERWDGKRNVFLTCSECFDLAEDRRTSLTRERERKERIALLKIRYT